MKRFALSLTLLIIIIHGSSSSGDQYSSNIQTGDKFTWSVLEYAIDGETISEVDFDNPRYYFEGAVVELEILMTPGNNNFGSIGFPEEFFQLTVSELHLPFINDITTAGEHASEIYFHLIELVMVIEDDDGSHLLDGFEGDDTAYVTDGRIVIGEDGFYRTFDYDTGVMLETVIISDDLTLRMYNISPQFTDLVNTNPKFSAPDTTDSDNSGFWGLNYPISIGSALLLFTIANFTKKKHFQ